MRQPPNGSRYWLAGGLYSTNENQKFVQIYFRTRTLPANPVHALLGGFWIDCNSITNLCDGISLNSADSGFSCLGKD